MYQLLSSFFMRCRNKIALGSKKKYGQGHKIDSIGSVNYFLLFVLIMFVAACSNDGKSQAALSAKTESKPNDKSTVKVDVKDFIANSGLQAMTPQVYIFDKSGELISTEYGFVPGQPLNIEAGKKGPAASNVDKLQKYLVANGAPFEDWKACDSDYCVVRLLPDQSLGECEYCDMTQSSLDSFFSSRGADVVYYSVLLAK